MKIILTIIAFMLSTSVNADSLAFKFGGWDGGSYIVDDSGAVKNLGKTNGGLIVYESSSCKMHCVAPYLVQVSSVGFRKNVGAGVDYVLKITNKNVGALRFYAGVVQFHKELNGGEKSNFHAGVSLDIYASSKVSAVLSFDHFANGNRLFNREDVDVDVPIQMASLGLRF